MKSRQRATECRRTAARGPEAIFALAALAATLLFATAASVAVATDDVPSSTAATPVQAAAPVSAAVLATPSPEPTPTPVPSVSATRSIGFSLKGRPIVLESFGSGARRILVLAGVHGNEYGIPVAERFSAYLRSHPSLLASGTQIDIVVCANPDGRALRRRTNARGVDLNRNFPAHNWSWRLGSGGVSPGKTPGSEPETKALIALLAEQRYTRVISLHSAIGVVDYDGKGGYTLAHRIGRASKYRVVRLAASRGYPGSMGTYVPERLKIPIVTWELSKPYFTERVLAGLLAGVK